MQIRRRELLRLAAAASLAAGCAPTSAPPPGLSGSAGGTTSTGSPPSSAPSSSGRVQLKWRLASSFPRSVDVLYGAAEVMAERVASMTDGAWDIRVYPAGELVPALQVFDAVSQGTLEMGQTAAYYYTGKDPVFAFDACVPFGLTARQQFAWLMEAGGGELLNARYADFGIVSIPGGSTGAQMGGWFRTPIRSKADLQGVKMRIPGLGGEVMSRLGVSPQTIAGGEIYSALELGAIDATEWVGPYDDEKLGFHKVVKHYHYPGWWEPGAMLSFYVSKAKLEALPADYQAILRTACREAGLTMQARYDHRNPAALARLVAAGVLVSPFPDDVMQAAAEASHQMLTEFAAKDPGYAKVLEHWRAFRAESDAWFSLAELRYENFAFGAAGAGRAPSSVP